MAKWRFKLSTSPNATDI